MPLNFEQIVEKEGRAMAFGMKPPFTHYAPKKEIDELLGQYDGTPIRKTMEQQISQLGGIMFSNTIIKPEAVKVEKDAEK